MTAACLVIGAGVNGASFLDFTNNVSSLLMALLALGALSCYLVALNGVAGRRYGARARGAALHSGEL